MHFQFLNNITQFFTHFFTHTYFKKLQTILLKLLYQTGTSFLNLFWLVLYYKLFSLIPIQLYNKYTINKAHMKEYSWQAKKGKVFFTIKFWWIPNFIYLFIFIKKKKLLCKLVNLI